ncbi:PAQR family membrane homeostasis protein TrhA [Muricoccus aerilatus]|uniref:PAQR family membrane homeostasis protein TrhA n=1 Tax=Muricoccus aerilatus TaxID=452982 RepID=UPI0005C204C1|nr:hemolysin III family protein [Roseomonas aerilata]
MSDPPPYSGAERGADAAVHAAGLLAVAAGCLLLAFRAPFPPGATLSMALGPYMAGLVATFAFSAAYNLSPAGPRRALLRRADHAAIFIMIAGTYTPVSVLAIGGTLAAVLLGFVWTGALIGAAMKLLAPARFERGSIVAYLVLGWVGVVALVPLSRTLSGWQLGLLAAGGLLYSLGVLVHLATRLRYNIAIWHGFVLAAAACHYGLVLSLAAA